MILLVAAGTAAPPAHASATYASLMRTRVIFDGLDPARRDKLTLVLRLVHPDKFDKTPIHLVLIDGGKTIDVTQDSEGTLPTTLNQDWITRGLEVHSDPPHQAFGLDISLHINAPAQGKLQVADVQAGVAQAQDVFSAGARAMGGMLAMLAAPKVHGVAIKPARCCDSVATLSAGAQTQQIATGKDGLIRISNADLAKFAAGTLVLSTPITWIDSDTD